MPFPFDVHAIFFSEDAVTLENELHKQFGDRRLNHVNQRREFFFVTPPKSIGYCREGQRLADDQGHAVHHLPAEEREHAGDNGITARIQSMVAIMLSSACF